MISILKDNRWAVSFLNLFGPTPFFPFQYAVVSTLGTVKGGM